jgi:hypothetical protein
MLVTKPSPGVLPSLTLNFFSQSKVFGHVKIMVDNNGELFVMMINVEVSAGNV